MIFKHNFKIILKNTNPYLINFKNLKKTIPDGNKDIPLWKIKKIKEFNFFSLN